MPVARASGPPSGDLWSWQKSGKSGRECSYLSRKATISFMHEQLGTIALHPMQCGNKLERKAAWVAFLEQQKIRKVLRKVHNANMQDLQSFNTR